MRTALVCAHLRTKHQNTCGSGPPWGYEGTLGWLLWGAGAFPYPHLKCHSCSLWPHTFDTETMTLEVTQASGSALFFLVVVKLLGEKKKGPCLFHGTLPYNLQ